MLKQIPNILTLGRVVLTVIFIVMILYLPGVADENKTRYLDIAFILFVIAGITDMIDGTVARALHVTSKFGRMMDPAADKILVCGAFISFAIIGQPAPLFDLSQQSLTIIQWVVAGIITLREVAITVIRQIAESKGINFAATWAGKIKMFVQSFAIGTIIIKAAHVPTANWAHWFTAVTLTLTVIVTIMSVLSLLNPKRWIRENEGNT